MSHKRPLSAISVDDDGGCRIEISDDFNSGGTSEGDKNNCTICFESFESTGEHQASCLSCGHVFGRGCILKWLETKKNCPQCKRPAYKKDVRTLFVDFGDASQPPAELAQEAAKASEAADALRRELERERRARREAQRETERLRAELERLTRGGGGGGGGPSASGRATSPTGEVIVLASPEHPSRGTMPFYFQQQQQQGVQLSLNGQSTSPSDGGVTAADSNRGRQQQQAARTSPVEVVELDSDDGEEDTALRYRPFWIVELRGAGPANLFDFAHSPSTVIWTCQSESEDSKTFLNLSDASFPGAPALRSVEAHSGPSTHLAVSPPSQDSDSFFVLSCSAREALIFDHQLNQMARYELPSDVVACTWSTKDRRVVFCALADGGIVALDHTWNKEMPRAALAPSGPPVTAMTFVHDPDSRVSGVLAASSTSLRMYTYASSPSGDGLVLSMLPLDAPLPSECKSLSYDPQRQHCLALCEPTPTNAMGSLLTFRVTSAGQLASQRQVVLPPRGSPIRHPITSALLFSEPSPETEEDDDDVQWVPSDSSALVAAAQPNSVELMYVTTGASFQSLDDHSAPITDLKHLRAASGDYFGLLLANSKVSVLKFS